MTARRLRAIAGGSLRVALGLSLLAALFWNSEPEKVWELFRRASPGLLFLVPLFSLARIWISALRFHVLLSPMHSIDRVALARQYFVAAYANNFLPTAVGGDALRIAMLRRERVPGRLALSLVLVERFVGVAVLAALSVAGAILVELPAPILGIIIALALGIGACVFALWRQLRVPAQGRRSRLIPRNLQLDGGTLGLVFAWSLVLQLCSVGLSWVVGMALGVVLPFGAYLALVPLVWVLTMLPLTVGGVGLREAGFVYLFGTLGVGSELSLAISLGTYAGLLFSGIFGGMFLAQDFILGRSIRVRDD